MSVCAGGQCRRVERGDVVDQARGSDRDRLVKELHRAGRGAGTRRDDRDRCRQGDRLTVDRGIWRDRQCRGGSRLVDDLVEDRRGAGLEVTVAAVDRRDRMAHDSQGRGGEGRRAAGVERPVAQRARAVHERDGAGGNPGAGGNGSDRGREGHRLAIDRGVDIRRQGGRAARLIDLLRNRRRRAGSEGAIAAIDRGDRMHPDRQVRCRERGGGRVVERRLSQSRRAIHERDRPRGCTAAGFRRHRGGEGHRLAVDRRANRRGHGGRRARTIDGERVGRVADQRRPIRISDAGAVGQ